MRYIELPVQYSTSTCTRQHEYAATAVYILHVHRSREHSAYNTLASDETRGKVEIQYKAEWCNGTTSVKMKTYVYFRSIRGAWIGSRMHPDPLLGSRIPVRHWIQTALEVKRSPAPQIFLSARKS